MALGYPYDTVVFITDTIGGRQYQGSGVLIAPDEVLTASHVVFSSDTGTASSIVVSPGYDAGSAPFGSAAGAWFHYEPVNDSGGLISNAQSQYDFAVIHLATPFDVGTMALGQNYAGGNAMITGYPGTTGGVQFTGTSFVFDDPTFSLLDGLGFGAGSSGGPVWTEQNGVPTVWGIVSSSALYGGQGYNVALTTADVNQIQSWVAQDEAVSAGPVSAHPGTITGTGGHPTIDFHGLRSEYTIGYTGGGDATITDSVAGRDGTVTSIGNEVLQFTDLPFFIESADGADIARLYSAGLGRIPDAGGLTGWENDYAANVPAAAKGQGVYVALAETSGGFNGTLSIADGIVDSPEFVGKYGALSNQDFVTQLYQNVLGRGPDAAGLAGWLDYMTPGNASGTTFTRGMVLVGFAESPENIKGAGAWLVDRSTAG